MTALDDATARSSRRRIVIESTRILLLSFLGWAAGGAVVWRLGTGSLGSDAGILLLASVLWAAIPLSILRILRWRDGARSPERGRPRTWGIWFVIAALVGSTIIGVVRPMTETWSTFQIWSAIFLLTPYGIALDALPRLVRPAGWTSIGAGVHRAIPLTLLSLSLASFVVAVVMVNGLPTEAALAIALLSLGVVVAFAAGLPLLANATIGLLFVGLSVVVQLAWLPHLASGVEDDPALLLAAHVWAALALIVATAIVQVFRHTGTSAAETALVDWMRAEAILPDAPATEGRATS